MALIDPDEIITLDDVPGKPGEWIKIRPLVAADLENIPDGLGSHVMVSMAIVEWSDPDPPTVEAIKKLRLTLFNWLLAEVTKASGTREPAEKKGYESEFSPTSDQAEERSLVNSATSPKSRG